VIRDWSLIMGGGEKRGWEKGVRKGGGFDDFFLNWGRPLTEKYVTRGDPNFLILTYSFSISAFIASHKIFHLPWFQRFFARRKKQEARRKTLWSHRLQIPLPHLIRFRIWISHVIGHLQKYVNSSLGNKHYCKLINIYCSFRIWISHVIGHL
jgi:hypothetical protein